MCLARVLGVGLLAAVMTGCVGARPPPTVPTRALSARVPRAHAPEPVASTAPAPEPLASAAPAPESLAGAPGDARARPDGEAEPSPAPRSAQSYPFQAPLPSNWLKRSSVAVHDANLSPGACGAALRRLRIEVRGAGRAAPGVATPLRLNGTLAGVTFVTPRTSTPYGIVDCRLILALHAFAKVVARHHVVALFIDSFYRPHAHLPGKRKLSQHAHGLAMDLMALKLADGTLLRVGDDWHGGIGRPTCGPKSSPTKITKASVELRDILCDVARAGIFQHVLTPNFNRAHKSHFHLDIERGTNYRFVR